MTQQEGPLDVRKRLSIQLFSKLIKLVNYKSVKMQETSHERVDSNVYSLELRDIINSTLSLVGK